MQARNALRAPNGYDTRKVSLAASLSVFDASRTNQADAYTADINNIVKQVLKGGNMPVIPPPTYADFTDAMDYHESMNYIRMAQESFLSLPAPIRARFDNDPGLFVDFCENPANLPAMREMGLAIPAAPPATPPVVAPTP